MGPGRFRQLLGHFATGVTIITLRRPDGQPIGMTANSLASVSLDPPLLSVCVDHQTVLHDAILAAREFMVNVLAGDQEALARRFAAKHDDRFKGVGHRITPEGHVLLDGALAHVECRRVAQYPGGDHTIVVGRVIGGSTHRGPPLVFFRGGYAVLE